jgi:hypothetical protein
MAVGDNQHGAMTLYAHWLVDCAVKVNAAVKASRGLDAGATRGTAAEAEVSRLCIAVYEKLNTLPDLVREYGADEVFGPRAAPLTAEQRKPAQL